MREIRKEELNDRLVIFIIEGNLLLQREEYLIKKLKAGDFYGDTEALLD
jgi:hypothetical protein